MENAGCYVAVGGPLLAGMFAAVQLMRAQNQASALMPASQETGPSGTIPGGTIVKTFLGFNVCLGFIVAVIINGKITPQNDGQLPATSNALFAAGLICGLTLAGVSLSIGAIGSVGSVCARKQRKILLGMLLVMIYAEAAAIYAVIISLVTVSKAQVARNVEGSADMTYGEAMQYAACAVAGLWGSLAGITQSGCANMKLGVFHPKMVMRGMMPVVMAGVLGIYTLIAVLCPSGGYNNVGAAMFICGVIMGFLGSKDLANLKNNPRGYVKMVLTQASIEALGLFAMVYSVVTGRVITRYFDTSEGEQPFTSSHGSQWFSGHSAEVFGDEDGSTAKLLLTASFIVFVGITIITATSVDSGDVEGPLLEEERLRTPESSD